MNMLQFVGVLLCLVLLSSSRADGASRGRVLTQATTSGCNLTSALSQVQLPLAKVHSHNDYDQKLPLFEALKQGYCSLEADPWLVDGVLYVAHDADALNKSITLESLYLEPLSRIIAGNKGVVYPATQWTGICRSVILLVDFKGGAYFNSSGGGMANATDVSRQSYTVLEALLAKYEARVPGMFTSWTKNASTNSTVRRPGAINAYVSGSRPPPAFVANLTQRYSALDGRLVDLNGPWGPEIYPLISQGWCCGGASVVQWLPANTTADKFPSVIDANQTRYVQSLVDKAHAQDRIIRIWATPDNPQAWKTFYDLGEDLVNTDFLAELRAFTLAQLAAANNATMAMRTATS